MHIHDGEDLSCLLGIVITVVVLLRVYLGSCFYFGFDAELFSAAESASASRAAVFNYYFNVLRLHLGTLYF